MAHPLTKEEKDLLRAYLLPFAPGDEQERADRALMLDALERQPLLLWRDSALAHFTASAWLVDAARQRTVLVYHNIYRSWSWCGGHADGAADLAAVARREAGEETGLTHVSQLAPQPLSLEILTVEPHWRRGAYVPAHVHLNLTFLFQADAEQPLSCAPAENSAVRWAALDEVLSLSSEAKMLPVYAKIIKKLRAGSF